MNGIFHFIGRRSAYGAFRYAQRRHAAGLSDQPLFAIQHTEQVPKVHGRISLQRNPDARCGVFGRLDSVPESLAACALEVAHRDEVHTGEATILSTVKVGAVKEYKIEISDINKSSTGTKSFRIRVTDPALIAITGGVVRGMSGSPIIQDGKLVGAVTHVMVANPTEGYGIFIENMLNAAQMPMAKAS